MHISLVHMAVLSVNWPVPSVTRYIVSCWCVCVCRNNRIAFCDTVLDRNRRCQLPETDSSIDHGRTETGSNLLDACFPFEVYNLTE